MSGAQLLWEDSSHLDGGTSKHRSSALVSQGEGDCLSLAQAERTYECDCALLSQANAE